MKHNVPIVSVKSKAKIYRNWTKHNVPIVSVKSKAKIYRNWTQHNVPIVSVKSKAKMELPQNLLQTFACVTSEKKTSYQKWSCFKIYGNLLPV